MTFLQYVTVIAFVLTSTVCGIPSGGKFTEDLTITSKSRNKSFAEQNHHLALQKGGTVCIKAKARLTAAQSKTALCNWLDALVTGITTVDPRVYNRAGAREDGMYHKLKQTEFARILAQISNLNQWGAQCSESIPPVSCGPFYMIIPGGRGGITLEQVFCGPFIS